MPIPTLLAVLAHPDDEVLCAGALMAQKAKGSRVVVLWLTKGEMTNAFGPISRAEVSRRRVDLGFKAIEILGVEGRFLDFPDSAVEASVEAAKRVARVIAEIKPDGILTWGNAWVRGFRHPDHQATGKITRDAVNFARIEKVVGAVGPHREFCPVFTMRDIHSSIPAVAIDVSDHMDKIFQVADHYRKSIGFGDVDWLQDRLQSSGSNWGIDYAEEFDAWETGGGLAKALLPHLNADFVHHPERI